MNIWTAGDIVSCIAAAIPTHRDTSYRNDIPTPRETAQQNQHSEDKQRRSMDNRTKLLPIQENSLTVKICLDKAAASSQQHVNPRRIHRPVHWNTGTRILLYSLMVIQARNTHISIRLSDLHPQAMPVTHQCSLFVRRAGTGVDTGGPGTNGETG